MTTVVEFAREDVLPTVALRMRRKRLIAFGVPTAIVAYFIYLFFSFDIAGLAQRLRLDNAAILVSDFVSHKTHVTRDNRSGDIRIAIEGEVKGTYPDGMTPEWITLNGDLTEVELPDGHSVTFIGNDRVSYDHPGYGVIDIALVNGRVNLTLPPGPVPDWINASQTRVTVTTEAGRMSMTRARTEVFRYSFGWELFWFTLDSPFYGKSLGELAGLALTGDRIDAARSNIGYMLSDFWTNAMWRHGDVLWAIFETILMAFLGTMTAALIALPLAFLAAANFTPFVAVRQVARRLFDFVRGVDGLIWTIILSRAFGPGPLTGALAIAITDTGSFGKMFSEALENVDDKQIEGIKSTGAKPLQRYRFGVIPQITPVLLSQVLYYLESNTRSATVIGAITGGGIGLLLTQAISTQKDWEEVSYYVILILIMVMAMDSFSGWLRRKLIKGE
jgi:phosphonate transport system permease protein